MHEYCRIAIEEYYEDTIKTYSNEVFVHEYAHRLFPRRRLPVWRGLSRFMRTLRPGARVLDVGCGTGKDVQVLRSRGYMAEGVDISEEMIGWARSNVGDFFRNVDLRDIRPIEAERFEGIISLAVLQHIHRSDIHLALRNMSSLLCDGGTMYLLTKQGEGEYWDTRFGNDFRRATTLYSRCEILGMLGMLGFSVEFEESFSLLREGSRDCWLALLGRKVANGSGDQ